MHKIILYTLLKSQTLYDVLKNIYPEEVQTIFNLNCGFGFKKGYPVGKFQDLKESLMLPNYSDVVIHCLEEDLVFLGERICVADVGMDLQGIENVLRYLKSNAGKTLDGKIYFLINKDSFYRICRDHIPLILNPEDVTIKTKDKDFRI